MPILTGGGTRVSCHVGVLQALAEMGIAYRRIVGVSGGSIVAALAAAGWRVEQMRELALNTDFGQFRGHSLMSLVRHGGLSNGDTFESWMDLQLQGLTFAELPLPLHVLATDINGGGPVLFDAQSSPRMKVSQAVRYSISIPLMFTFKEHQGHIMADGVILSEDALHRDWSGSGVPVVCFRLRSQGRARPLQARRMLPIASYVTMLLQTFMNAVSREYVHADHWHRTVIINTGEISAVDFALSQAQHAALLQAGHRTTCAVLAQKLAHDRRSEADPEPGP